MILNLNSALKANLRQQQQQKNSNCVLVKAKIGKTKIYSWVNKNINKNCQELSNLVKFAFC